MYSFIFLSCIYLQFLSFQTLIDNSHDYMDLSGVTTTSDGLMFEHPDFHSNDSDEISPLCVPQDRLEDLDFFPDFNDDLIPCRLLFTDSEQEYLDKIELEKDPRKDFRRKAGDVEIKKPFLAKDSSSSHDDVRELSSSPPDKLYITEHKINDDIHSSMNAPCVNLSRKPRSKRRNRSLQSKSRNNFTKNRRCSHCETENTPQWRMGPEGPKTLCNACGVRYKSGRLVPEYRPAASPTFDSMKHSNFHRRIMQKKITFRRKK